MLKRGYPLVVLSLLLSACAGTTPVALKDAKPVPADRVYAFQEPTKGATLTLIRDQGHIGSGCFFGLWVNNTLTARMDPSEFVTVYVEPGEVLLRAGKDPQGRLLCGADLDNWTQRETVLKAGEAKTFRVSMDENFKFDIMRTND